MMELDYLELIKEAKKISENKDRYKEVKIAVLGDNSTQQFVQILRAYFYREGIYANIYESEFDVIEQEIYNDDSGLYKFKPDYVVFHVSNQKLRDRFYQNNGPAPDFEAYLVDSQIKQWEKINKKLKCRIIQNLYSMPTERPFGNYTQQVESSLYNLTKMVNSRLIANAKDAGNVYFNDIEHLSTSIGLDNWYDEKLYVHAKLFCKLEYMPQVAKNILDIILAGLGRSKKCVVLDLDDTLWGGIVAEDGLERIEISREGLGEAYYLFQKYLLELKNIGIILAVCSKNDHENAIEPFEKHPEMVIKKDDISVFIANWNSKSENIKQISKKLNIGLDSMVFIDNSAFERNQVKSMLPQVEVPEMPEDISEYVPFINKLNLFEALAYSKEDGKRTEFYKNQVKREEVKAEYKSIDDYLKSLEMVAEFNRFDSMHIPRIAQLIQRSNQFNLTTKRYNEKECETFMNAAECYPFYITLKDKFGDNGLISVIIAKKEGEKLIIDEWLMSCRVLLRGVEEFCMNKVVGLAKELGCSEIEGRYIKTAKNNMVKEFYKRFGFSSVGPKLDSETTWKLEVKKYKEKKIWINQ